MKSIINNFRLQQKAAPAIIKIKSKSIAFSKRSLAKCYKIGNFQNKLLIGIIWAANPNDSGISKPEDIVTILNNLVNWTFTILMVVAVIFILSAAFLFLTAAGDTEKISKAKSQLMWSIVAIAVALVAKGVSLIVENILGIGSSP